MKDRFVKVMLVIFAGLLFLNRIDNGSVIPPPTKASVPNFIEVGKFYDCWIPVVGNYRFKIEYVDKESGWVKEETYNNNTSAGYQWKNLSHFASFIQQDLPT